MRILMLRSKTGDRDAYGEYEHFHRWKEYDIDDELGHAFIRAHVAIKVGENDDEL